MQAWGLHTGNLVQPKTAAQWISSDTWAGLIHNEVLRQCDGLDGVSALTMLMEECITGSLG